MRIGVAVAACLMMLPIGAGSAQASSLRTAAVPGTSCTVFPAGNIWNTDISTLPINASSTTWVNHTMPGSGLTHPDFGRPPYGIPYNVVSNAHATATLTFDYPTESDAGPYPW